MKREAVQSVGVRRVIIDSQSNPHFLGLESEQDFDQRAALSQGKSGDVVITTNPIDPGYVKYWKHLGFSIPTLLTAGPFEENQILSELILNKNEVKSSLLKAVNGYDVRLEFFTPSVKEQRLAEDLKMPSYINFEFANEFQRKSNFKDLCKQAGISALPYVDKTHGGVEWEDVVLMLGESQNGYIAKHVYGTGGAGLGTIVPIKSKAEYDALKDEYIIEKLIPVAMEISMHWEIDFNGNIKFLNCFEQLAENVSYVGTIFPTKIPNDLLDSIFVEYKMLTECIVKRGGLGFMCCDILVCNDGHFYWSDLNPRKGAILFIYDAVNRYLKNKEMEGKSHFVRHQHTSQAKVSSFAELQVLLGKRLVPKKSGFVLVTNPGIIRHGSVDLTAISFLSHEHAFNMLDEARDLIKL